jgi:proliferating cell nuclear antigen
MKLTLAEPKYLKDGLAIVSEIVTEATIKVSKDVVELIAMDPANVAMVAFRLPASSFVGYELDKDTNLTVNLNSLKQILRRTKSSDTLVLEQDENKLKIVLQSTSTRTFFLPLIDIEDKEQKIPSLQFVATISTLSSLLNDAVDDVDVVVTIQFSTDYPLKINYIVKDKVELSFVLAPRVDND